MIARDVLKADGNPISPADGWVQIMMDDIKTTAANTRLVCTANLKLVSGSGAAETKVVISSNGGQVYEIVPAIDVGRGAILIDDWDVTPGNHNVAVYLRASGSTASVTPARLTSLWIEPHDYP